MINETGVAFSCRDGSPEQAVLTVKVTELTFCSRLGLSRIPHRLDTRKTHIWGGFIPVAVLLAGVGMARGDAMEVKQMSRNQMVWKNLPGPR